MGGGWCSTGTLACVQPEEGIRRKHRQECLCYDVTDPHVGEGCFRLRRLMPRRRMMDVGISLRAAEGT